MIFVLSVAVLSVSAATSNTNGYITYSAGLPVDLLFTNKRKSDDAVLSRTLISNANVSLNGGYTNTITSGTASADIDFAFSLGSNDVIITNAYANAYVQLTSFSSSVPFQLPDYSEVGALMPVTLGNTIRLEWVELAVDQYYDALPVTYTYTVISSLPQAPNNPVTLTYTFVHQVPAPWVPSSPSVGYSSYSADIPNFFESDLQQIHQALVDTGRDGSLTYVTRIDGSLEYGLPGMGSQMATGSKVYIKDQSPSTFTYGEVISSVGYTFYESIQDATIEVDYDQLDWTLWLSNAVKGFLSFELVPGLSLAGIFGILLGIPLLIWFLRMFAGG